MKRRIVDADGRELSFRPGDMVIDGKLVNLLDPEGARALGEALASGNVLGFDMDPLTFSQD